MYRRGAGLAWQWVAGEGLVLDVERKVVRGLNPVGYRIWELLDGSRRVEQVVEILAEEFPEARARLADDVERFVAELCARSLIEAVP